MAKTESLVSYAAQSLSLLLGIWMGKSPSFSRLFFSFFFYILARLFFFFHRSIIWSLMISIFFLFSSYFFIDPTSFFSSLLPTCVEKKNRTKQLTGIIWRLIGEWLIFPQFFFQVVCVCVCHIYPKPPQKGISIIRLVHQASNDITQQARNSFHNCHYKYTSHLPLFGVAINKDRSNPSME